MNATEWAVLTGGVAAIVWVNWYFFFAGRAAVVAAAGSAGVQEVRIVVEGGYSPATVRLRSGEPARLVFRREETSGCSEEVVIPAFGVRRYLPTLEETVVEVGPAEPGTYEFTCGMGMLRGKLVVE